MTSLDALAHLLLGTPGSSQTSESVIFFLRSITNTSDVAKPYARAMNVTVEVQVDMEVMTKYLARICKCIEVNAQNTSKTKNTVQVGRIVRENVKHKLQKRVALLRE